MKTLNFQYDATGNLLSAAEAGSQSTVSWKYKAGLVDEESLTLTNNISVKYSHEYQAGMLKSLTTRLNGNVDSTLNFTYTLDDLVKSIQQTGPNVTTKSIKYGYG